MGVCKGNGKKKMTEKFFEEKLPKPGKETYTGPGSTENPKHDEPKVIHINTNHN